MTMTQDLHKLATKASGSTTSRAGSWTTAPSSATSTSCRSSRPDLEPDHLRTKRSALRPVRQEHPAKGAKRFVRETLFVELALEDLRRAPTCSGPNSTHARNGRAGCRWRCLRSLPKTPGPPSRRPSGIHKLADRPNLLRQDPVPGRRPAIGGKPSLPACRSTSRCCSPGNTIWPSRRPTCGASSGASPAKLDPKVKLGRLDLRQPLGTGAVAGKGARGAHQPAGNRRHLSLSFLLG